MTTYADKTTNDISGVGAVCKTARKMTRHTTFKFCLDPTIEQQTVLSRHAGAARFAYNQCLRMVKTALAQRRTDPPIEVPWTGFDLIKAFNAWKKTADAGRVFAVSPGGVVETEVTGLAWRSQVCQQVFGEAAVDCSRALTAWSDSRSGKRRGRCTGFPRFKKKIEATPSFRLRNKCGRSGKPSIRIGESNPRSVALPGIGSVRLHDDTRRLRRLLDKGRAKILFASVSHHAGRWWVGLNIEAADLHPAQRHPARLTGDSGGWVGLDRGLSAFLVAATSDGRKVGRINEAPKALAAGMRKQRHLSRSLSPKKKGSCNRRRAAARLARHHNHVRNLRQHFVHQVSNEMVKTHDRLVLEDLNVAGMLANHRLAKAISDAGWAEFARLVHYKAEWRGGTVALADRWYPSSQLCSRCGTKNGRLTLADRVFTCGCGHIRDRDVNAAANLAKWGEEQQVHANSRTPKHGGRVTDARRRDGADRRPAGVGETSPEDVGTDVHAAPAV
jgi:putative transposase